MDNNSIDYRKDSIDEKFEQVKKKLNLEKVSSKKNTRSKAVTSKNDEENASKKRLPPLPVIPEDNVTGSISQEEINNLEQSTEVSEPDGSKDKDKIIKEEKRDVKEDNKDSGSGRVIVQDQQFVVFSIDGEEFGIGINEVFEITKVKETTRVPNTQSFIKGVINLRGRIHSVIDLARKLDLPTKEMDKDSRIIIVETKVDTLGILVDSVKEVIKVNSANIKPVPHVFGSKIDKEFIRNVLTMGERLVIVLDLSKIINVDDAEALMQAKSFVGN